MEKETNNPKQEQDKNEEIEWETFLERDEEWEQSKERQKKRKKLIFRTISTVLVVAMLISGLQIWFNLFNLPALEFLKVSQRLSKNPEVQAYKQAVVTIEWDGVKGTGFTINKRGVIVTNEHVVEHTDTVKVYFHGGESYVGEVIIKNPELDLAIVKIEASNLPVLPLSFEDDWEKSEGQKILFIGNPLSFTQIANEGTIAGKVLLEDWEIPVMMIAAPVYRGNSGSPVLNQKGEVIGVLFATISSPEGNNRVGVAIPTHYLIELLENSKPSS
jgi:serine protease Do